MCTSRNTVFFGKEQLKADTVDTILRGLSFSPSRIAKKSEILWSDKKKQSHYSGKRKDIYAKIKKFMLQPIRKRSKAKWNDILLEIKAYNVEAKKAGQTLITRSSLKNQFRRVQRVPKRERLRAA